MKRAATFILGILLACTALPAFAQSNTPQFIVVFDGSGSMWGKLPGTDLHKFAFMRRELMRHLRGDLKDHAVGLTTFGARSGNSCRSARIALPPTQGDADAFEEVLTTFNPQGRGPIFLGLTEAVSSIDPSKGATRLLLVHDSPDNCGQDVCALASELASKKITVDVISLALKPNQLGGMSCLTNATGGLLLEVQSAQEATAALDQVVAANTIVEGAISAVPERTRRATKGAKKKSATRSNLTLSARLSQTGEPITTGLSWRISSERGTFSRSFTSARVEVILPPDRYVVELETATWSKRTEIDLTDAQPRAEIFEFDGGLLSLQPRPRPSGEPSLSVLTISRQEGATAAPVWIGPSSKARGLLLPAAQYRVIYSDGILRRREDVTVKAGQKHEIEPAAPQSELVVTTLGLSEAQAAAAVISLWGDGEKPGQKRLVARTSGSQARFQLPGGVYEVSLTAFGAESRTQVVVGQHQTVQETLSLSQLSLRVSSFLGETKSLPAPRVRYRIWQIGTGSDTTRTSRKLRPVFHLSPGKYRIESRIGEQNSVLIREFSVNTSGQGDLDLHHPAGIVNFALADGVPLSNPNAHWALSDTRGRPVWRGFADAPSLTLAAGKYEAKLDLGKGTYYAKFAVVSGQRQIITLAKAPGK